MPFFPGFINEDRLRELLTTMGDRFTEDEVRLIIDFFFQPGLTVESGLSILIHGIISLCYVISTIIIYLGPYLP